MKQRIQELAHAEEFHPFTIVTASGREYHVPTRDHIFAPRLPNAMIIVINDAGEVTHLSTLLINSVTVKQEEPA